MILVYFDRDSRIKRYLMLSDITVLVTWTYELVTFMKNKVKTTSLKIIFCNFALSNKF